MTAFHETKLYTFADHNRNKDWELPPVWKQPNDWLKEEVSSLESAYNGYPFTPRRNKELKDFSSEELYDLATLWVKFMIKLFNKPPAPPKKKSTKKPASKNAPA